jgi:hypothetical protein
LVELPGANLGAILDKWWSLDAKDGRVILGRRLWLGPPRPEPGGAWAMSGRLQRFTRWHRVPVVVDLFPVYSKWTRMDMRPQVRVITSERYFRKGHAVLDRFTAALLRSSSPVTPGGPPCR